MSRFAALFLVTCVLAAAFGAHLVWHAATPAEALATQAPAPASGDLVPGKTQPAPGRSARIAPAVLHPVVEVLVKAGERVKKDQRLVEIDADEPKADLAAKKAILEAARASLARLKAEPRDEEIKEAEATLHVAEVSLKEAQHYSERIRPGWEQGVVPEQRYHEARARLDRAQGEKRAATARLHKLRRRPFAQEVAELTAKVAEADANVKASEAELEHYTVPAAIDGVVSWLDVNLGTVARPGTTVWGEILDLREIDVRCEVKPGQLDRIHIGDTAEVIVDEERGTALPGKVAVVGIAADPASGRVPVVVRLANPDERLRCYVDVKVRFPGSKTQVSGR